MKFTQKVNSVVMDIDTTLTDGIAGRNLEQAKGRLDHSDPGNHSNFDVLRELDGLLAKEGLDAEDVIQVQALADEVRRADNVGLKLNWETRDSRIPNQVSDFCYYVGGHLVGYAPLDGSGDELEVTAAVLSSHRRQGVFRLLLDAARQEAQRRGARRLLLVSYPASQAGTAAVRALGLRYVFSEYRMEAEAAALPSLGEGNVRLNQANAANITDLARLRTLSFGDSTKSPEALLGELDTPGVRYFLAECGGEYVGQIGVVDIGDGAYIRGFGLVPERRRRGYGHQLLAATVQLMLTEGHQHFALDVATDNAQALNLYESCGFRVTEAYDYHAVPLTEPG